MGTLNRLIFSSGPSKFGLISYSSSPPWPCPDLCGRILQKVSLGVHGPHGCGD
ncbi:hypothetical protein K438DRAFT_1873277 [Mycena galopus ATCC 62051]|nr:hypothetical protein K438DRAFT_1873277 [Mycena galopus ATCC 62051]